MRQQNLHERLQKALNDQHPEQALEALVLALHAEGTTKQAIYEAFHEAFQKTTKEADLDELTTILDRLVGWCHSDAELLPE